MQKPRGRLITILVILSIVPITLIPVGKYADRMGFCLRESWVGSMVIATFLPGLAAGITGGAELWRIRSGKPDSADRGTAKTGLSYGIVVLLVVLTPITLAIMIARELEGRSSI